MNCFQRSRRKVERASLACVLWRLFPKKNTRNERLLHSFGTISEKESRGMNICSIFSQYSVTRIHGLRMKGYCIFGNYFLIRITRNERLLCSFRTILE